MPYRQRCRINAVALIVMSGPATSGAQVTLAGRGSLQPPVAVRVSREEAVRLAVARAPRGALARADSSAAAAAIAQARQFENPTLSGSYSQSTPRAHVAVDIPFDWGRTRRPRIAAANTGLVAALIRITYARAALELDVDTAYTRAQSRAARTALAARSARDADSLLVLANVRRDAGDASDLDVELATVFSGQSANAAAEDSIAAIDARLTLQTIVGLPLDSVSLELADTLTLHTGELQLSLARGDAMVRVPASGRGTAPAIAGGSAARAPGASPLLTAAAEREAQAAGYLLLVEQGRRVIAPSLSIGFETIDPGGDKGLLPTIGVAFPLPLFNRNQAGIQAAQAAVLRAQANVAIARLEQAAALSAALRNVNGAQLRAERSARLVASADRVAALSLLAYREGAASLPTALDAQRAAREALSQHIDDLAAARIAASLLHLSGLTTSPQPE
jgi:cobalt-zinc-cadmium efflux system outer membrane protein